jgi:hypothetical protein
MDSVTAPPAMHTHVRSRGTSGDRLPWRMHYSDSVVLEDLLGCVLPLNFTRSASARLAWSMIAANTLDSTARALA